MLTQPVIIIPTSRHEEIVSNYFVCPNKKNIIRINGEKVNIEDLEINGEKVNEYLERKCEKENKIYEKKQFCKKNKNKCSFYENHTDFCDFMILIVIIIVMVFFIKLAGA